MSRLVQLVNWSASFTAQFSAPYAMGVLLLSAVLMSPSTDANENLGKLFESVVDRFILSETIEGSAVFKSLVGPSTKGSLALLDARLEQPELLTVRTDLEQRLHRIRTRFNASAVHQSTRIEAADAEGRAALSPEEKLLLRSIASKELQINPDWASSSSSESAQVDFFEPSPAHNFKGNQAEFLIASDIPDPALESNPEAVPATERVGARGRLARSFDKMKACRDALPSTESSTKNYKYLLTQLGIDELSTVGGAVIAAGSGKVEWKNLPNDLVFEAMHSALGSRITWSTGSVMVRWFRLGGIGVAQSGADAILYYFSPLKETHGESPKESAFDRMEFNSAWNVGYAPINIALYELFMGLECLYPQGKGAAGVLGLQLFSGLGANVAYFGLRNHFSAKDGH